MEKTGNKKARLVVESVKVKQEAGSSSSAIVVAAAPDPSAMVAVEFDKHLLDCPLCSLPLKPPVFQCRARHTACGCCATSHSNKCPACTDGGAYEHTDVLDTYLLAAKVRCPNEAHGCRSSVAYCLAGEHQLVCPHAPCRCPEPGCAFLGSPPALCRHLATHHAWPVTDIAYGSVLELHMQPAERRHLLLAENGERVFLVVASERGGGERVVKLVCVRASAEDGPWWYRCMVWVHAPVDPETGRKDVVMLEAKVTTCADPCEKAAMDAGGRCLHVSGDDVPPEGGILLRVRIDKLQLRPPLPGAN